MALVQGPACTKRSSPAWSYAKGSDNYTYLYLNSDDTVNAACCVLLFLLLLLRNIAYCVLRTENIFVCCCGVGSDRAAGVGVSLGTSFQCA